MIFLDMDGVFADFHAGYRAISGGEEPPPMEARSRAEEKAMWDRINATPDFFLTLPEVEGAYDFWLKLLFCEDVSNIAFLTACPSSNFHDVAQQKKEWIKALCWPFNPLVIPTNGSKAKPAYINHVGDVLIDDHETNCAQWEAVGGKAIHFKGDWNDVWNQLMEHYEHREFV